MAKNSGKLKFHLTELGELLQQIERCNERIKMLTSYQEPELEQSIMNAQSLRGQFLEQLDDLFSQYNLEVKFRAAA